MTSFSLFGTIGVSALLILIPPAIAAPGDLNVSFGTGGKVTTDFANNNDSGSSVVAQSDGKIVVAGTAIIGSNRDFALARYTSSGALDSSFGTGGKLTTPIGSGADFGQSVAVQSDGKIVIAGFSAYSPTNSNNDFALARYTDSGALDSSFGTGGKVTTPIGSSNDGGSGVAVQSNGKIVVAGFASVGSTTDFALVRYTESGALDSGFGTGGKVTTAIGSSTDAGLSMAIQSDGKIIVAGYSSNGSSGNDFALVRYTDSGALDTSFGTGGKVTTPIGTSAGVGRSVALQSDGKIVVAGHAYNGSNNDFALARYTESGALDSSFGTGGKVITPVGSSDDWGFSVAIQSDGKIVVAGYSSNEGNWDFALVRYTSSGALDTSLGTSGKVITPMGSGDDGLSVAVQSDGKIVVAGFSGGFPNNDFTLVRYEGGSPGDSDSDGLLDTWELAYWPTIPEHKALDDFDGDGLTELEELAFGLNPTIPDAASLPQTVNEGGYLTMTITKHAGVTYEVQSAGTLLDGQPTSFSPATTTILLNDPTTLKVRDNFLIGTTPTRYLRVKVTASP